MDAPETASAPSAPRWRPLERHERRVAGVLAEKAKTTPDSYPMTLNALINGCNQKSNRFPQTQLDESQVSEALDGLRHAGAVAMIQGDSRVEKYRHLLYDWLGVDKAELAVMTELLLRGAQTLGELRGRAARMEPIRDMGELMPIVDRLKQKGLLIYLTPAGRGAVVTHNLYQPQELAKVKADVGSHAEANRTAGDPEGGSYFPPPVTGPASAATSQAPPPAPRELDELRAEMALLKDELAELQTTVDDLKRRWDG